MEKKQTLSYLRWIGGVPEMIHSFLLIGQSNMAGRGFPHEVQPIENPNIQVLRNGRWRTMYVPVNADRPFSGICLAESFADLYTHDHEAEAGLIPCADGGSSIDQWTVGGLLFDHAMYQAELASRTSTIAGVLWHQGESDCDEDRWPRYEEKLSIILDTMRRKLALDDVPFLLGGLGEYLSLREEEQFRSGRFHQINAALKSYADTHAMTGFVPAEGLESNPDHLHFSAAALREFGVRYYQEFRKLEKPDKVFEEKAHPDLAVRRWIEEL